MPDIKEYQALLKRSGDLKAFEVRNQQAAILPRIVELTHKSQTVVDHPGWQFYLDSLETRIKAVESRRTVTTNKMVFGTAMGHELELLKIELNVMDAEINALRFAADLIPTAIAEGRKAVAGVNTVAAAPSLAH